MTVYLYLLGILQSQNMVTQIQRNPFLQRRSESEYLVSFPFYAINYQHFVLAFNGHGFLYICMFTDGIYIEDVIEVLITNAQPKRIPAQSKTFIGLGFHIQ